MEVPAKFYLYYTYGSCNYGDHNWGLEEFNTLAEALAEGRRLHEHNHGDGGYTVVEGRFRGDESTKE